MTEAPEAARGRPWGVIAVSALLTAIALQGVVVVVCGVLRRQVPVELIPLLSEVTLVLDIRRPSFTLLIVVGAIMIALFIPLAIGFWLLRRWAWVGAMLTISVTLTIHVIAWLFGEAGAREMWSGLGIPILMALYLNRRDVQSLFDARDEERPAATMLPRGVQ